jgi:hypothetical protein
MPRRYALFSIIAWTAAAILAMAWGTTYNWPDYLNVTYGYPLTWANHTLDTFVGPVDKWSLDMAALLVDLIFWVGTLAVGASVLLLWRRPTSKAPPP